MRPITKKCVIISAELTKTPETNVHNSEVLETLIVKHGLSYKHMVGCYKGQREASFLVEYDTQLPLLLDWAKRFNQESVLLLDEDRNARLSYISNSRKDMNIGKLKPVSKQEVLKLEAWSYCTLNHQFYGVL